MAGLDIHQPLGSYVSDLATACNDSDYSRDLARRYVSLHHTVETVQPLAREAYLFR